MRETDFTKFRRDALAVARSNKCHDDAEDFAQDAAIEVLEGRDSTSLKLQLVDFLRHNYGRRDPKAPKDPTDKYQPKRAINKSYQQITDANTPKVDQVHNMDFETLTQDNLTPRHTAYMNLIYKWGFTLQEVADTFNVTESRVCQEVKEINVKLRKAAQDPKKPYIVSPPGKA